jgi:hypothetical protein
MLAGLQKRAAEIQERLDLICLDRLDKNISEEPFDSLAVTNAAWLEEKAVSGVEDGISVIWLPGLDSNQQPFG